MEFNPNNPVIQRCMQGMGMEEQGQHNEAGKIFMQAWDEAGNDFEKYIAAHFVARHQKNSSDKLKWLNTCLEFALKVNSHTTQGALPALYLTIAKCYEELNEPGNAKKNQELALLCKNNISDSGPFYHGTKANLNVGDLLTSGVMSNYKSDLVMNHIYFTANANGAGLAAALAKGEGDERVYIIEPTGLFENDPNVTDKKFPGNPTRSYRSLAPLKIVGEIKDWVRQTPEQIKHWKEKLAGNAGEIIN